MPPKKKDKSKGTDWLQCSQCDRVISLSDAEAHSTSCPDCDHGFILDKAIHGKAQTAEKLLDEEGSPVTKSVKNHSNTVWLSVQAMQMCGLSIGQPCVVNRVLARRAWPAKITPTGVAMTKSELELLNIAVGTFITVERFQCTGDVATSVSLQLETPNNLFETDEFSAFVSAHLDGKFISLGTPLRIQYFGNTCECRVHSITTPTKTFNSGDASSRANLQTPSSTGENQQSTPLTEEHPPGESPHPGLADHTACEPLTPNRNLNSTKLSSGDALSESFSSLNISNLSSSCLSSPDVMNRGQVYSNLHTPIKSLSTGSPKYQPFVKVTAGTRVSVLMQSAVEATRDIKSQGSVSLKELGGLTSQIKELTSRIKRAQQTSTSSRCILIYGPPGTGKTVLARALTEDVGLHSIYVAGTDIWSKLFGEAESNLKKLFQRAIDRSPSILVIDDIDVLCPRHAQSGQQVHRIVGTLLSLIDTHTSSKTDQLVILGVTNNKDNVDPALLRAGRFGCEVEIGVPTAQQRLEILKILLTKVEHSLKDTDVTTVSKNAHGYVGADLSALVNEACMHAFGRSRVESGIVPPLTMEDFVYAGLHIKPSALREIQLDIPEVRWSDIGGMHEVKMRLREAVELPLSNPEVFTSLGIEPPRGLLMYGPPGCSKTMVARALATECRLNFLAVKGPELFNQYVGESEKAIREVFRKARSAAPSVIFFDEIDAIAAKRGGSSGGSGVDDRVLTQLLTEMDGMETLRDVFVMAATNRPDKMDRALLRPGRFDSLVYVPLPDASTRQEILEKKFSKMKVGPDVSITTLVEQTDNYSGAEVIQVCQEAALFALRESLTASQVHQRHVESALIKVQPQIDPELLDIYDKFSKLKS